MWIITAEHALKLQHPANHIGRGVPPTEGPTRYLINGKPVHKFTLRNERAIQLAREQSSCIGTVMSADEATKAYVKKISWLFGILGGLVFVLIGIIIIGGGTSLLADESDGWVIFPGGFVILVLFGIFMWWRYTSLIRQWNEKLGSRTVALTAPGSAVEIDDSGLTLGGAVHPWSSLSIETVELIQSQGQEDTVYFIDRLLLSAAGNNPILDSSVIHGGRIIVDNAYRRLRKSVE